LKDNDVSLAHAVGASAAFPIFLPALDEEVAFVDHDGTVKKHRILLTDGGVYDNLGTTVLEPGRTSDFSYNLFDVEYIISCDAGHGMLSGDSVPYWFLPRVARSFETVFRKAQNAAQDRLHRLRATGAIKGFVLAYLGQQDHRLPYRPADLVPRDAVVGYPTDFAAMPDIDIKNLASRGERLTRLLIDHYCPEL
jgi:NTE family protein